MKTIMLVTLLASISLTSSCQKLKDSDVPANVKQTLTELYPNAKVSKWEKEKGNYEAEFENNKVETSVLIDADGKLMETEVEIAVNELPSAVNDYVSKNFSSKKITEASRITDNAGVVTYEAEVAKKDLIFDSAGNYIKTESDDHDDEDDDK